MKNILVDVKFINNNGKILKKDDKLIEEKSLKIVQEYTKYINAVIIK